MSVIDRLGDAQHLYEAGRLHGALLSLLVAVAGTSRRRYSRDEVPGDRAAFTRFLGEEMERLTASCCNTASQQLNAYFRGEMQPLEQILYVYARCELAHEGTLAPDIIFVRDPTLFVKLGNGSLILNEVFLQGLANVVLMAPENRVDLNRGARISNMK